MPQQPRLYPEFGALFFNILVEYLPPSSKKNKNTIAEYLIGQIKKRGEQVGRGYRANVSAWLNGDIAGRKSLSPVSFLHILKLLAADNRYTLTVDDVESLIEKGREDYKTILQDEFFQSLRVYSRPLMAPAPYIIRREEIENHIVEVLSAEGTPIVVLYGPPGRGKKMLMRLTTRQRLDILPRRSIVIVGQTVKLLTEWVKLAINKPKVTETNSLHFLMEEFRAKFNGQSVVFTLSDCEEREVLEWLQKYLPAGCKLLVSTHHATIAENIPSLPVIRIPPFTEKETVEYMQAYVPGQVWTSEEFRQFYKLTMGTPLTLYLANRHILESGMEFVLDKLSIIPVLDQVEELAGLHRSILLGFESLAPKLKEAFGKIGLLDNYLSYDLLTFQALWQNSPGELLGRGETREYLLRLCDQAGLIQSVGKDEWEIHPVIKKFAERTFPSIEKKELEIARQWLPVVIHSPEARWEYHTALQSTYLIWSESPDIEKDKLRKSPLPQQFPLVIRAIRSLFYIKSVDLYQLLENNRSSFSAKEARHIKLAELENAESWKPITLYVTIILGLYLCLIFTKITAFFAIAIVLTLILIYHHSKEREQIRKRDLLIYQIWRRRISGN
jgi:hypothetical protein